MPTIAEARKAATKKRELREAREAEAKRKAAEKPEKKEESGFFESIRKAFSSDDDIDRIDSAVEAMESGVKDADADDKRKK